MTKKHKAADAEENGAKKITKRESLRKKHPNITNDELDTLIARPDVILPGMFETSQEFEAARHASHVQHQMDNIHILTGQPKEEE